MILTLINQDLTLFYCFMLINVVYLYSSIKENNINQFKIKVMTKKEFSKTVLKYRGYEVYVEEMTENSSDKYCYSLNREYHPKRTGKSIEECKSKAVEEINKMLIKKSDNIFEA